MRPAIQHVELAAGTSFTSFRRDATHYPFRWHHHVEIEMTLIERGRGRRFVGDHVDEYRDGDLVLIGPWLPHTWASDDTRQQRAVVVQFLEGLISGLAERAAEFAAIGTLLQRVRRGLAFPSVTTETAAAISAIANPVHGPRATGERLTTLLNVLNTLAHTDNSAPLASSAYASDPPPADARIARVLRIVGKTFVDDVTQAAAARMAGMTPEAFSRLFHRHTGRTFQRHVHDLRIGRACRMLQESDRSITDICFAAGFGNVANFNRVFLKLKGETPRAYRKKFT